MAKGILEGQLRVIIQGEAGGAVKDTVEKVFECTSIIFPIIL